MEHLDFHNNELINYYDIHKQEEKSPNKLKVKILHEAIYDKWLIEINDEKTKNISYQNSLGMKYLTYLIQYFRDGHTIEDNVLLAIVLKWHNKGKVSKINVIDKNKLSKPAAHSIDQALHYLFSKQCPELYPLKRYVHITDINPGCWYENNLLIDCEIIDDQMPPKN